LVGPDRPANVEVSKLAQVAQRHVPAHVDDVVSDAMVRLVDEAARGHLVAPFVGDQGCLAIARAMWSHLVVVADDVIKDTLKFHETLRGTLREELLQGAVPALDLALGLRMVGRGVFVEDATLEQIALKARASAA
jgi:hypothetical protein